MDRKYILRQLRIIKSFVDSNPRKTDDEVAHSLEDKLHQEVLEAIAKGQIENPSVAAKLALRTLKMDFARYYS